MLTVDHGMTFAGVGLAMGFASFAYFAIEANDGTPKVNGQEHLAVFGKPSRVHDARDVSLGAQAIARVDDDASSRRVDYEPTATIKMPRNEARKVARVLHDRVMIEDAIGVSELRPGAAVAGPGRLEEIRLVDGRWTAIFAQEVGERQSSR